LPREELRELSEEPGDRVCLVFQSASFLGEFALALQKVLPGFLISAEALMQPPACQLPIACEGPRGIEKRERLCIATCARQIIAPQEVNLCGRGECLCPIEQVLRAREVSAYLIQGGPVRERLHSARSQLVGMSEVVVCKVRAALFQQVEGEVHE